MPTDADTTANAELLWNLVHAVQETIGKRGEPLVVEFAEALRDLRRQADEIDPDFGRY